jgi:glycosyltransferase involved in cell wall biosynthesis
MNSRRIIILNYGLHISGVSRALINLANALAERGHDVTIKLEIPNFTLASELDNRVKCELFFKEWRLFGKRIPGFLRCYYAFLKTQNKISPKLLHRLIVGKGYDVEIAFNRGAAARIIAASNTGATTLVWVHSDYLRCQNPLAGFESLDEAHNAYAQFDRIVCLSGQSEMSFRLLLGDYNSIAMCCNVLNIDHIRKKANAIYPRENGRKTLCAIGRICEAKNYPMLLDAVALLNNRGVEFTLWIVGDGEDMDAIAAQKDAQGLDNVILWGAKENPYPYLAQADGYVCSSIYEGLSTTTIEALVLGKACVVTDCTGMRDILGDSEYGLVVPISTEALADGMQQLIENDALRIHYEQMALRRSKAYEPEHCVKKIEELFS